jgi:hypothetical protein
MSSLLKELATLDLRSRWVDGEIFVMRADGVPDFNAL